MATGMHFARRSLLGACIGIMASLAACSPPPLVTTPTSIPIVSTPTGGSVASAPLVITSATPLLNSSPAEPAEPAASPASSPGLPDSAGDTSQSPATCANPYYPISATGIWRYRISGTVPSAMTETRRPSSPASFIVRDVFPDVSLEVEWRCGQDGLLASQLPRINTGQSPLRFSATEVRGVTIPAPERWMVGSVWSTEYDVHAVGEGGAGGSVTITSTIDGAERLSVPAGDFQTLRVMEHIVMDLHIDTRGLSLPMTMTFATTQWFARDVGLVRSAASGELGDTVSELVEFAP